MAREINCPKHGPYDYRLGGCPECQRPGRCDDELERTRVVSGPDASVGSIADLGGEPLSQSAARGGDATVATGHGQGAPASGWEQTGRTQSSTQQPSWSAWGQQKPASPVEDAESTIVVRREAPAPEIPLAWLAIVSGPGGKPHTVYPLKAETLVGRGHGDIVLAGDPKVSGQHTKIRLELSDEGEAYILYDLASANGTYVGARDTYREESSRVYRHRLSDNDFILLGETTLVFKQVAG